MDRKISSRSHLFGHPYIITLLPIILLIISIIYSILLHKKYDYWASFPANFTMYIILFNHVKGQIVKIGQIISHHMIFIINIQLLLNLILKLYIIYIKYILLFYNNSKILFKLKLKESLT